MFKTYLSLPPKNSSLSKAFFLLYPYLIWLTKNFGVLPRDSLSIEQKADDKSHDYDASPLFRLPEQPEKLVTEKQKNLPVFFFFFVLLFC